MASTPKTKRPSSSAPKAAAKTSKKAQPSDGQPTPCPAEADELALVRARAGTRTGLDKETLQRAYAEHLQYTQGKDEH